MNLERKQAWGVVLSSIASRTNPVGVVPTAAGCSPNDVLGQCVGCVTWTIIPWVGWAGISFTTGIHTLVTPGRFLQINCGIIPWVRTQHPGHNVEIPWKVAYLNYFLGLTSTEREKVLCSEQLLLMNYHWFGLTTVHGHWCYFQALLAVNITINSFLLSNCWLSGKRYAPC